MDFPFKILHDRLGTGTGGAATWLVGVLLDKDNWSKENLEHLFRFLSRSHPDPKQDLRAVVYSDQSRVPKPGPGSVGPHEPEVSKPYQPAETAAFFREGRSLGAFAPSEWFAFYSDPDDLSHTKTVVLKGRHPHADKANALSREFNSSAITIRATAYDLLGVEPTGTYYTFEALTPNLPFAVEIMTVREDQRKAVRPDRIRFVGDRVCYLWEGWMVAVTVDGGSTWDVWDGDTELPGWHCCRADLIKQVRIDPLGNGKMELNPHPGERIPTTLSTTDYGKHWAP
jgi:hypothetical protein